MPPSHPMPPRRLRTRTRTRTRALPARIRMYTRTTPRQATLSRPLLRELAQAALCALCPKRFVQGVSVTMRMLRSIAVLVFVSHVLACSEEEPSARKSLGGVEGQTPLKELNDSQRDAVCDAADDKLEAAFSD